MLCDSFERFNVNGSHIGLNDSNFPAHANVFFLNVWIRTREIFTYLQPNEYSLFLMADRGIYW